jgi:hypothetical protein
VAIGGLLVSTFLTMVYVPIFYSLFEDAELAVRRLFRRRAVNGAATLPPPATDPVA